MAMRRVPLLGTGVLSILIGSLYAFRAFGPTEAEVAQWGGFCMLAGLCALAAATPRSYPATLRLTGAIGFGVLAAAQILPILLWFIFHGMSISDPTPPSPFTAHWAWALPHALLFLGAAASAVRLWRNT
ncbi:MAG TPA: hypothetical protein VD969_22335 [Symbiobacteriaceae bacterium]|nr:hypothetical protein [Symbiobacteriaceae bacterium]